MDHPEEDNYSQSRTPLDRPHGPYSITNQIEDGDETRDREDIGGQTGGIHFIAIPKMIHPPLLFTSK
jgi:hypothetical protein